MRIKQLEIKGFKSFSDKTVFELKPGITAIVGPNGCGKSNVFEAIRWVMGEQRARSLRGKKMEDVIFNGSENRKPVGMTEVRLVLSNREGQGPPSMADYEEIMIARRLFRDGESQYEINNVPCRLAEITDFFLDTGVGKNSYAIIEQGRVDMVVASKPEDRRVLIEEAAGISRYKTRREAAIKKLEQTQQNLLRISDVISEVRRQNASLKRQAQKAERYRKIRDRLQELDLALHAHRCAQLQQQLGRMQEDLERKRADLFEKQAHFASRQAELESTRLAALHTEKALQELVEAQHGIDLELAQIRAAMDRDRTRVAQIAEFKTRAELETATLETKREELKTTLTELEQDRDRISAEIQSQRGDLEQALNRMQSLEERLSRQRKLQEELKEETFRVLQESANERNTRESLARRQVENRSELARRSKEAADMRGLLNDRNKKREELLEQARTIEASLEAATEKKAELSRVINELRGQINALRQELGQKEQELAAVTGRLDSLHELHEAYASYGEGVRYLMQSRTPEMEEDLVGPLAELIEVPAEHEKALSAALGDRLGHMVVSSPRAGAEAALLLDEARAGRSTFIPCCPRSDLNGEHMDVSEALTRLKEVVRFREGYEKLGDFLLGRSFLVEDIEQAIEIWERNGAYIDLVTRNGEVLNRHGEITGGSQGNAGEEIFAKRRQLEELTAKQSEIAHETNRFRAAITQDEKRLDGLVHDLDVTYKLIQDLTVQQAGMRKDREVLEAEIQSSQRRLGVLTLEEERLTKDLEELSAQTQTCEEKLRVLEAQREQLEQKSRDAAQEIQQLAETYAKQSGESSEIRVRLAQMEERARSVERELKTSRESFAGLQNRWSALAEEMKRNSDEELSLGETIRQNQGHERELMERHANQAGKMETLRHDSEDSTRAVQSLQAQVQQEEKSIRDLGETVHAGETESVRVEQSLEGIVEKILDRYRIDPRTVTPPEHVPDQNEIYELKSKLETFGEVNLAAIAESHQIEERLEFLLEQEADLKQAVESLFETIHKINKTTRERFREAFEQVNEKFQEIFPFLFRGGEARLELTDEQDLLETGVEILARPPGKKIRNMDLLSGGEKALTAVALIFAIFLTRPSPFCLLDEVDASLDEANIIRFNEMLRRLSDKTQFLVITHNKRTMEAADTLYGVTMEDPGSSGVVSVEFAA
jgi:chromosome segregation protein